MSAVKRVEMDGEGPRKTRFGSAAARPGLNAAGDPEDDEEEEKKKPEEDEEEEENDGEEEEVPWQVAACFEPMRANAGSDQRNTFFELDIVAKNAAFEGLDAIFDGEIAALIRVRFPLRVERVQFAEFKPGASFIAFHQEYWRSPCLRD